MGRWGGTKLTGERKENQRGVVGEGNGGKKRQPMTRELAQKGWGKGRGKNEKVFTKEKNTTEEGRPGSKGNRGR